MATVWLRYGYGLATVSLRYGYGCGYGTATGECKNRKNYCNKRFKAAMVANPDLRSGFETDLNPD